MSTAPRHKFLLYAPDMTDPEGFERRLRVRSKHLENAHIMMEGGSVKLGGAMLTPESLHPGAEKKMIGSVMIYEAENIDEVKELVLADIYYTSKVWDAEKLVITPFVLAAHSLE